ncbi:MAG: FAD-dependent oxidoreductase [Gemmatimonadota bacterium]|nr:FAD-dependent oxidoreductase [Gemmatimonadota bacterium]
MPRITIDGRDIDVPQGSTVLDAARKLGIDIPTLCFMEGCAPRSSCMLCVVEDTDSHRLIPACSAPVEEGMKIDTGGDLVLNARKKILELLLGEHAGDCEGPCTLACPARLDIPLMLRLTAAGKISEAAAAVKQAVALPAVLGRICPAPCEAVCRRKQHDSPVAIRLVKRYVADLNLASDKPFRPRINPATGKKVAIIGAGPTGLSTAYYLQQKGYQCVVFDEHENPGGMLRYGVPEHLLPRGVLESEINSLQATGFELRLKTKVGSDIDLDTMRREFDAVVLATGTADSAAALFPGLAGSEKFLSVDKITCSTAEKGVFTGGGTVRTGRLAVRSVADGKTIALAVHRFLSGDTAAASEKRFDSRLGPLQDGELAVFLKDANPDGRTEPALGDESGFSPAEAQQESGRCLNCDCRRKESCRLREYAGGCSAKTKRSPGGSRRPVARIIDHPDIVYEPGKCILCGRCVTVSQQVGEPLGLTFVGRGIQTVVGVPFDEPLSRGLTTAALRCVKACPTGALSCKSKERGPVALEEQNIPL